MKRLAILGLILILTAGCNSKEKYQPIAQTGGGRAIRGKKLVQDYGCTACHSIPGVPGPKGMVGPPLDKMGNRPLIAGKFKNTPQNMMAWLQNPQALDPQNAMPALGVTPADARDMTAFIENLK